MKWNRLILASTIGAATAIAGCNKPAGEARNEAEEARSAQTEAEQKRIEAQRDLEKVTAEARAAAADKAREAQAEVNEAHAEAVDKVRTAQGKLSEEASEAAESLSKAKTEYRAKAEREIADVSKAIDELKAEVVNATGKAKTDVEAAIADAEQRRAMVEQDLKNLQVATAQELERVADRVEKQIVELRKRVRSAAEKI